MRLHYIIEEPKRVESKAKANAKPKIKITKEPVRSVFIISNRKNSN